MVGIFWVGKVVQYYDEFVVIEVFEQIVVVQVLVQVCGGCFEQCIFGGMVEGVVDGFEIVQVNEQYCQWCFVIVGFFDCIGCLFVQQYVVGQVGQQVVVGQQFDVFVGFVFVGDVME